MGMFKPVSGCSCECSSTVGTYNDTPASYLERERRPAWKPPNPNPSDFVVEDVRVINNYTILVVKYPKCTNFEGKKILVIDKIMSSTDLANMKALDPHFCEHNPNLIARFRSDKLQDAIRFCECLV